MFGTSLIPAVATYLALAVQSAPSGMPAQKVHTLSVHEMPLGDRYAVPSVNEVFRKNILLTLAYLKGTASKEKTLDWKEIDHPQRYSFILKPGELFTFHDTVLNEYTGKITVSTQAHFSSSEGFLSDGYLAGDGVCHLASLVYWVAVDSGLKALAPTPHDFAHIPDIPKAYGVAIYDDPASASTSAQQNLYVTNSKTKPVLFSFDYEKNILTVSLSEIE